MDKSYDIHSDLFRKILCYRYSACISNEGFLFPAQTWIRTPDWSIGHLVVQVDGVRWGCSVAWGRIAARWGAVLVPRWTIVILIGRRGIHVWVIHRRTKKSSHISVILQIDTQFLL